jgi:hypothetical protein
MNYSFVSCMEGLGELVFPICFPCCQYGTIIRRQGFTVPQVSERTSSSKDTGPRLGLYLGRLFIFILFFLLWWYWGSSQASALPLELHP